MSRQVKVSVVMLTYNHAKYIEQAILGVLQQETSFHFELIVGNDGSSDETDRIIKRLIRENKNKLCEIVYVSHEHNVGMGKNADSVFSRAKGQYIAFCEGDDFWQEKAKVQRQVDIMEANLAATICFHAVNIVDEKNKVLQEQRWDEEIEPSFEALFIHNFIQTPSVMYRNIFNTLMLDWMMDLGAGDWIMHLRHAEKGKIVYINQVMASYRVHAGGVWSQANVTVKRLKWIAVVDAVINNLFPQYEYGLNYTKKNCLFALSTSHFFSGHLILAGKYLCRALSLKTDPPMSFWVLIKIASNKLRKEFLKTIDKIHA